MKKLILSVFAAVALFGTSSAVRAADDHPGAPDNKAGKKDNDKNDDKGKDPADHDKNDDKGNDPVDHDRNDDHGGLRVGHK